MEGERADCIDKLWNDVRGPALENKRRWMGAVSGSKGDADADVWRFGGGGGVGLFVTTVPVNIFPPREKKTPTPT
jgi:hypothetical protein